MTVTTKQLLLASLTILGVVFVYLARGMLTPFVFAAAFAFIFTPVVEGAAEHLRLPKTLSIFLIYIVLLALTVSAAAYLGGRLLAEAKQISGGGNIDTAARSAINNLPDWQISGQTFGLKSSAEQFLNSLKEVANTYQAQAIPFFTGALTEVVGVLVFFLASFYFMRDSARTRSQLLSSLPPRYRDDVRIIFSKVSVILGNYLRGQVILIVIMAVLAYLALSILGVKYALIIAILTGFLEIIPYVGPITAGAIAVGASYLTGQNNFSLDPVSLAAVVLVIYFILRQLEDYFVIPHLYARLTQLHPLVVIFAVLAGGQLFGIVGLVLAVPVAASIKVITGYLLTSS